jgi:hypothetical protein
MGGSDRERESGRWRGRAAGERAAVEVSVVSVVSGDGVVVR